MTYPTAFELATLCGLYDGFLAGDFTPEDYLDYCLSRIAALNPALNAVLEVYEAEARAAAIAATLRYKNGQQKSKIDGMPIGVKANIAVRGHVCHGGIKAYEDFIPRHDADVVHRLRRAGGYIIGSLNMEEGALGAQTDNPWYGKCFNPLKDGYTPGGSSGGSAAAVAAGMMPASLGTDTMGSVRIPSSYCGLVGFKPSPGEYAVDGVMPLSPTLDTVGTHTHTVDDVLVLYKVLTAHKGKLSARAPRHYASFDLSSTDVQPDVVRAYSQFLDSLSMPRRGDVLRGYEYSAQRRAGLVISEVEGAAVHADKDFANHPDFSAHFKNMLSFGASLPAEKINDARAKLVLAQNLADDCFENNDCLIAPTAPQTAFRFGDDVPANQADFTAFANFARLPALSFPIGTDSDGLPIGVQIMTKSGRDRALLGMAKALAS